MRAPCAANVTVTADRLIAYYRKKQPAPGAPAAGNPAATKPATPVAVTPPAPGAPGIAAEPETGDNEIYRLVAEGHVHIYTRLTPRSPTTRSMTSTRRCWC